MIPFILALIQVFTTNPNLDATTGTVLVTVSDKPTGAPLPACTPLMRRFLALSDEDADTLILSNPPPWIVRGLEYRACTMAGLDCCQ